ncbi:MAG: undecaprenyldiphospho-muramoylpentapeptide beta-N-acetylglucosaminyltransferase [bacterium]|nr:undecaprenyldiphospho-muramoylpentapeptide beta-N-acetylglucosaminyltransferase [bacterium]
MRVLLTGGGTGGHAYPALAIARALRDLQPEVELLYAGTRRGVEASLAAREGIPFRAIRARGLYGKSFGDRVRGVGELVVGLAQAWRLVREYRPAVVVGTGGYASAPIVAAAALARVPVLLQEQNAFPGRANRLLARWAGAVGVPYPQTARGFPRRARCVVTGNPVRPEVTGITRQEGARVLELHPDRPTVYAFGGSLGARRLNLALLGALPRLLERPGLQVIWSTGPGQREEMLAGLAAAGVDPRRPGLLVFDYLHDAPAALAAADLVVSRGGGVTLAEITARGIPAIIVPSPNVAHDEQTHNAGILEAGGAARLIPEAVLDGPRLAGEIQALLDDAARRRAMAAASRALGRPDAAERLARLALELAGTYVTPRRGGS